LSGSVEQLLEKGFLWVSIPVAVTVFPGEQFEAPRSWAERAYPKLIYYNRAEKGGHFAAWEQPMIFARELRGPSSLSAKEGARTDSFAPASSNREFHKCVSSHNDRYFDE
jgi:hypothetical protein